MASTTSTQAKPIHINTSSNETGFDFPLSPSEPGKFDFYRVHLNNQAHKNDSMFSDNYEAPSLPNEGPRRWTPFGNMKHLSEQPRTASSSAIYPSTLKSATDADIPSPNNKALNKPIQTVASFSSLTDAVKNAMTRGHSSGLNQLKRPASGATLSTKDLNHLSPQSM